MSFNSAAEIPVTRKKNSSLVLTKRGTFETVCLPHQKLNSQANFVFYRAKKRQEDGLLIPFTELLRIFWSSMPLTLMEILSQNISW